MNLDGFKARQLVRIERDENIADEPGLIAGEANRQSRRTTLRQNGASTAIHVGDPAIAHLMGVADPIHGHVESISAGVVDRERSDHESTLANVNPSFSWVRLAQRIPVRIAIDKIPAGVQLIVGQTATVEVQPRPGHVTVKRSFPW